MADSGLRKVGQWDLAGLLTRNLNSDIDKSNKIVLMQIGLELEGMIVKRIHSQPSEWEPLSEKYQKRKAKEGKSNLMLIATSTMVNSVTSVVKYPLVAAGVKRGAFNEDGVEVANVAAVMHFGSEKRNIPPRDFLTKPYQEMRKKIAGGLFQKRLLQFIRKKYRTG